MWILAALYPPETNAQRVMKYRENVAKLNCDMLEFPVKHTSSKISQFEDANNVSINIYRYDPTYKAAPLRISEKQSRDKAVDLLLIDNTDGNTHYTWLKNMSHLMHGGIGHKTTGKTVDCKRCFTGFKTGAKLDEHKLICTDKGFVQRSVFPTEENKMLHFKHDKNKWLLPFVVYADMECKLEETDDENVISKHTLISIAYSVASIDPKWNRDCWVYTGDDCVQQFLLSLDKLKLDLSDVMNLQLPMKPLSPVQQEKHLNATECYLCQKQFNENEETARKHVNQCHITGEYRGPACQYCNMNNLSLKGVELPVFFHNLKGYDMHHIIKEVQDRKVDVIGTSKEKLITAKVYVLKEEDDGGEDVGKKFDISKFNYQVKDSFAFMSTSLATLASNLEKKDLVSVSEFVKNYFLKKRYPGHKCYPEPPSSEIETQLQIQRLRQERRGAKYEGRCLFPSKMDDYRNWPPVEDPTHIDEITQEQITSGLDLLMRKGVFPYEWMNEDEKLYTTSLPPKECFHSELYNEDISDEEYEHARKLWDHFECATFEEYHNLYLITDVLLLRDVFDKFRKTCMEYYQLDAARYLTAPSLAWDAMLLYTGVEIELLTEDKHDIHTMHEDHVRGRQVSLQTRLIECDDKSGICYIDANNLYGYAMSLPLPTGGHEFLSREGIETKKWDEKLNRDMDDCSYGYVFEVDLEYPKELHDEHDDLPFCAEKRKIKEELSPFQKDLLGDEKLMTSVKLLTTLYDKKKYMIHERYLKLALVNGLKLSYIHNVIRFKQAKFMKSYIDFNTQKRTEAKNEFEKDFFKLMNNAVYGKTLENMRNHVKMRVITDGDKMERYIRNPEFYGSMLINDDVAIVTERVKIAKLKTPVFIGGTVLDNSKHLMYDFKYHHGRQIFGEDM